MNRQQNFPWLTFFVGAGCMAILCIGVLVVFGIAAVFLFQAQSVVPPSVLEPIATVLVGTLEPPPIAPTVAPPPTVEATPAEPPESPPDTPEPPPAEPTASEPSQPEPESSEPELTGNQWIDEYSLFDDFSSEALGWPIYDDGMTILKYEQQAYSFQIMEPEYYDWAYFPVDFTPYEIWFDVQGPAGLQDGTFGVFCQFQDEYNYYFVEFELETNSYVIGQILDDESIPLTAQNSVGQYWWEAEALKSPSTATNRIGVSCYLDSITLFVNDEWVDEVSIQQPFDHPGEAAFFMNTYHFLDGNGYKIIFDNVEVWQPVQ